MKGIKIIDPGMYSTIQDNGRSGYREFGLPVSGAMDLKSLNLANWLVKNDMNEAVIETLFPGIEIEFLSNTLFSVTGGDMSPHLNSKAISNWKAYKAKPGMRLGLTKLVSGSRSYISFSGGFRIDPELGSLSTYSPAALGGYRGRELKSGDIIPLYPGIPLLFKTRHIPSNLIPVYNSCLELRVLPGVDFELFDNETRSVFFGSEFLVSARSDRMGIRLEGQTINRSDSKQIISYGIQAGTIQIPGDGNPIIMGSDCQTIGGYPQLVSIISADIFKLGQLKQGDKLRFKLVSHSEAIELLKRERNELDSLYGVKASVCTDCIQKRT